MKKYTHVESIVHVARYVKKTNLDPECPEKYKVRTPVTFRGTVKLHGTNAGVCCTPEGLVPQSRTRALTEEEDNAGFAKYLARPEVAAAFRDLEALVRESQGLSPDSPLYLYGEWCGPGIQKGTAVNELPTQQFVWFATSGVRPGDDEIRYLDAVVPLEGKLAAAQIYSVMDAPIWEVTVDFSNQEQRQEALDKMTAWTQEVEKSCPYGALFGVQGVGEGIVWVPTGEHWGNSDLYFKTKGDKHKVTKPRKKETMDPELLASVQEFVSFAVTENRLEQGWTVLQEQGKPLEMRSMGDFLKWVAQDVQRECVTELDASGLAWKAVVKAVSARSRDFFMKKVNESFSS